MDDLDRKILTLLGKNARMPVKDIAHAVNLTSPAVSSRIRHMEASGLIRGYTVVLNDPESASRVDALVSVATKLNAHNDFLHFVASTPEVLQCFRVTGEFSHIVKLNCANITQLEHMINSLQAFGSTSTQVILSTPIQRSAPQLN